MRLPAQFKLPPFLPFPHLPPLPALVLACGCLAGSATLAQNSGQGLGISSQGTTGGLVIPSAYTLPAGTVAASAGNTSESTLGPFSYKGNYTFGIGLSDHIELSGRLTDYVNPVPGTTLVAGVRDLSANLKLKLPTFWQAQPTIAVGVNDVAGGASFFRSRYVVTSEQFGPVQLTAGYAWNEQIPNTGLATNFKGFFGGAQVNLGNTGLALLGEYDGSQRHVGVRYISQPFASLGNLRLIGTLQRASGDTFPAGNPDATSFSLGVVIPLGQNALQLGQKPPENSLPALAAAPTGGMVATAEDRMESLSKALVTVGLERVRVGQAGTMLVVEYENNRYLQSEADAIGLVLGLAAEHAPAEVAKVQAVTLKAGQAVYQTSVAVPAYRAFLRNGDAGAARASLTVQRPHSATNLAVRWQQERATGNSPVRIEIKPEITYAVGTEVGLFDFSLAANLQAIVSLWGGAELYTSAIKQLGNTENFNTGFAFAAARQRDGLRVAAVQQSFWLGPNVFANVGVGRYNYDSNGVQGEATVFVPGRDDVLRLRGGVYQPAAGQTFGPLDWQGSASYRWVYAPDTWVEAGYQQYSDGSRGPSVELTRWFGDFSVHIYYRRGDTRQFAGLELSIPLTPRQGMAPSPIVLTGSPQVARGLRTRITDANTTTNDIDFNSVRDLRLDYNAELRQLNAGRSSQSYFASQLPRMRDAFYRFARDLVVN